MLFSIVDQLKMRLTSRNSQVNESKLEQRRKDIPLGSKIKTTFSQIIDFHAHLKKSAFKNPHPTLYRTRVLL